MNQSSDPGKPVVESKASGNRPDMTERALNLRLRQQEILAELGVHALQGTEFLELLNLTVALAAEGLEAEYCKVLEFIPAENRLLVRAGVGWDKDIVGIATVGADMASPAGYALHTGKPVISNHLENEERFRTPELLVEHGIHRAMNVILQGDNAPFGVLEFGKHDIAFLQGAANILGMAIEHQRSQRKLQNALDRHELLLKEVNHRVKNSLQVVIGMLRLQASAAPDSELSAGLLEAASRISTIGRAYDHLAYAADYEKIDLVEYLRGVFNELHASVAPNVIHFEARGEIRIAGERAILIGLIVNELISNAGKYAYPGDASGPIWISVAQIEDRSVSISVRDEGVGMPPGYDATQSKRLGTRLVTALSQQLKATLTNPASARGTNTSLVIPLEA
jgi:two-component sensor histidine kinase